MPAKSKAQQSFMGMVHAAQTGELKNASPAVKKAAKSISKKDAEDFASTKHEGLPKHVKEDEETVPEKVTFLSFLEDVADIQERFESGELQLDEAKKTSKLTKSMVKKVYHRDYLKTRNKPYRQYDKKKRTAEDNGSE